MLNTISEAWSRNKSQMLPVIYVMVAWLVFLALGDRERLSNLPWLDIVAYLGQKGMELLLFIILLKIILTSGSVLSNMRSILKEILFERGFLKALNKEELMKIGGDITGAHEDISFEDLGRKHTAIRNTIEDWEGMNEADRDDFIILESDSITTLYADGQVITNNRFRIKMMRTAPFVSWHGYIPYDKEFKAPEEEPYLSEVPLNRWEGKSVKHHIPGNSIHHFMVNKSIVEDEGKRSVRFDLRTEELRKGLEFELEYSISDKISLVNTPEDNARREKFFSNDYEGAGKMTAHRKIIFQIEAYNDTDGHKLPYVPMVYFNDDTTGKSFDSCKETVYYRRWVYERYNERSSHNTCRITLTRGTSSDCST